MSAAYECCVCFSNDEDDKKHTYCKHPLCIHCFKKIDKCPFCRATKGFKKKKKDVIQELPQPTIQYIHTSIIRVPNNPTLVFDIPNSPNAFYSPYALYFQLERR